jgi:hypothetical protein
MHSRSAFFVGALGVAFGMLCFAVALALPAAMVGSKPDASTPAGVSDTVNRDTVNRAAKGDRLRVIVRPPGDKPFEVQAPDDSSPQSRDGCTSAFGPTDHSPAANLARSCVT